MSQAQLKLSYFEETFILDPLEEKLAEIKSQTQELIHMAQIFKEQKLLKKVCLQLVEGLKTKQDIYNLFGKEKTKLGQMFRISCDVRSQHLKICRKKLKKVKIFTEVESFLKTNNNISYIFTGVNLGIIGTILVLQNQNYYQQQLQKELVSNNQKIVLYHYIEACILLDNSDIDIDLLVNCIAINIIKIQNQDSILRQQQLDKFGERIGMLLEKYPDTKYVSSKIYLEWIMQQVSYKKN